VSVVTLIVVVDALALVLNTDDGALKESVYEPSAMVVRSLRKAVCATKFGAKVISSLVAKVQFPRVEPATGQVVVNVTFPPVT
jgi:hypothetical protein